MMHSLCWADSKHIVGCGSSSLSVAQMMYSSVWPIASTDTVACGMFVLACGMGVLGCGL